MILLRVLRGHVPLRALVAGLVMAAVVPAAVVVSGTRERNALEPATEAVRGSVVEAAAVLNCFEGVQDDLFTAPGERAGAEVAVRRLATCDITRLERAVHRIALPPRALVSDGRQRELRSAIETARGILEDVARDARGTKLAMAEDLSGGNAGARLQLGYETVRAGYERAVLLLARADSLLPSPA